MGPGAASPSGRRSRKSGRLDVVPGLIYVPSLIVVTAASKNISILDYLLSEQMLEMHKQHKSVKSQLIP